MRDYLLSSAVLWQAPDTPGAPDPAVGEGAPPPAAADPGAAAPPPEPAAGAPPAEPPKPDARRTVPLDTMLQRVSAEQGRANREREARLAAEREAADAKAMLARLQSPPSGGAPPAAAPAPAAPAAPAGDQSAYQRDVQQAAAAQRLYEDSVALRNAGMAQFGAQFNETLRVLEAVGATGSDEFVADVLAADKANAHVLLTKIAQDPERAVALVGMPSRMRMVELTKMLDKPAAAAAAPAPAPAAPKPISQAPAPRPPSEPATPPSNENPLYDDKADDDAWSRAWDAKHRRKRA